jgi:hypothetical protein
VYSTVPPSASFADAPLVDRIKLAAGDPHTDPRVKKKLMSVLASWYRQFKDDPRMQNVAGLYRKCGGGQQVRSLFLSSILPLEVH